MKISKIFIALVGLTAIIIWASSSSCSSKQISCSDDASFKSVSGILVSKCGKCHKDSTTAANYARGLIYDFSDWNTVTNNTYFNNYDTTTATGSPYDVTTFGGMTFLDIEGIGFGHPMPLGGPKLTDCEINTIRNWLFKGAPNN